MRKIITASIVTSLMSTAVVAATSWVEPPLDRCPAMGGDGVCSANWADATALCESVGARLPTIGELRQEVEGCGGVLNALQQNSRNEDYKSCFQAAGFSMNGSYWSGTEEGTGSDNAWYLGFYLGNDRAGDKGSVTHLRCVAQ